MLRRAESDDRNLLAESEVDLEIATLVDFVHLCNTKVVEINI